MVAALSLSKYEAVRVVPGSVDGEEFLNYIVNNVVRHLFYFLDFYSIICQLLNMNPTLRSILILGNCTIHKTHAL
jgi:hypothetical protein